MPLYSKLKGEHLFILRREQLDVLADVYTAQKFEERLLEHLRETWPEECAELSETGLRRRVLNGVCKATEYGFSEESHISRFMNLIFLWGDDFDSNDGRPRAREILHSKTLSARNKMAQLMILAEEELEETGDEGSDQGSLR